MPPTTLADWLAYIERQNPRPIDMGLERVREVAARMQLGRAARHVITVGGTNGKGSTVAFIEAIARAAGWKVGAYTSPHLLAYNERVRIDGHDVDDASLVAAFAAVEAARTGEGRAVALTYFEYGTLAALWLFERSTLDLAILEVGLGGRLDAVNVVDADVAVITTVDLDHQGWLGNDREQIGFEKAGIARAWKPLVLGEDDPPSSVLGHAYAIGASTWRAGNDFFFERIDDARWRWFERRQAAIAAGLARARAASVTGTPAVNDLLGRLGSAPVSGRRVTLAELARRPELSWAAVERVAAAGGVAAQVVDGELADEVWLRVETELVYEGYLRRQEVDAARLAQADAVALPDDLDYGAIPGLSREVVEKLGALRPRSLGQASRVAGVTPAAVSILMTHVALTRRRAADVPSGG